MRGKRMAEIQLLAPYGGITRIRFKGSSETSRTLSAIGSPACCSEYDRERSEVNAAMRLDRRPG